MKIVDLNVVCIASIHEANTWYIFRANGIEVKIVLIEGKIKSSKGLTELELEYLNNNLR